MILNTLLKYNYMSLRIRLRRNRKKNEPSFQIIVIDSRKKRDGEYIEKLGFYNPTKPVHPKFTLDLARADYWVSVGAQPSERVAKFIEIERTGNHFIPEAKQ